MFIARGYKMLGGGGKRNLVVGNKTYAYWGIEYVYNWIADRPSNWRRGRS